MQCGVYAVIPIELTRDVIEKIILNGEKAGLKCSNRGFLGEKEKFKKDDIQSLIDHLYATSHTISPSVYGAWVSGYVPD